MSPKTKVELARLNETDKAQIFDAFADCCSDLIQDIADKYNVDFETVLHIIDSKVNLIRPKPKSPNIYPPTEDNQGIR